MYKPNGEEPMNKQEEVRRRAALAERAHRELKPENLRSALYAALYGAVQSTREGIGATFTQAR
jgi:hypothetical protein